MSVSALPSWLPASAGHVEEEVALATLRKLQRCQVHVPLLKRSLQTVYVETAAASSAATPAAAGKGGSSPPLVFLSSFDASCLEFRMLMPLLEAAGAEAYAVDLVGWGFTEARIDPKEREVLGSAERRAHLLAFCQEKIKRPTVFVGSSLNASTVVDFALHHPEATAKLVLMGPAAWNEGLGLFPLLPRWAAILGTQVLRSGWFSGGSEVCFDKSLVTQDTTRIGRLHHDVPGWSEAIMAFVRGGGYHLRAVIPQLSVETLVLWGRNDKFANPKFAVKYEENIKHCQVVWFDKCGHWPSFEHPEETAKLLLQFVSSGLPVHP